MTLKILLIDDSEDFRLLAAQYMAIEWPDAEIEEWDPVQRGEIPESLDLAQFNVILLDYELGIGDGIEWLRRLRQRQDCPPIIFVTGRGGEATAVNAMKGGAFDYLRKHDLSRARLVDAVHSAVQERALNTRRISTVRIVEPENLGTRILPGVQGGRAVEAPFDPKTQPLGADFSVTIGPGQTHKIAINGYRMIRPLGAGGMATVYLAERLADHQELVLKILDSGASDDNDFLMRFIREHGLLSKIDSPGIVHIYDQGFTDRHVYIAMEYFAGGDLRQKMKSSVAPAEAIRILANLAEALEAVHAADIVHRDLKPDNIMFRGDGTLAVVDFGVAKGVSETMTLTMQGDVLGTPHYLSPEQACGERLDGRSDLYSSGIVLYEMLTGKRPFRAGDALTLALMHVNDSMPALPAELARYQKLMDRLTAKTPGDRFADAGQLIAYLRTHHADDLAGAGPDIADQLPLIDEERFANLSADLRGDQQMLNKVIASFTRNATARLAEIERALACGDAQALTLHAHTLKGGSRTVGAAQLAAFAERIEELARNGALADIQGLIVQTAACTKHTVEQLTNCVDPGA